MLTWVTLWLCSRQWNGKFGGPIRERNWLQRRSSFEGVCLLTDPSRWCDICRESPEGQFRSWQYTFVVGKVGIDNAVQVNRKKYKPQLCRSAVLSLVGRRPPNCNEAMWTVSCTCNCTFLYLKLSYLKLCERKEDSSISRSNFHLKEDGIGLASTSQTNLADSKSDSP